MSLLSQFVDSELIFPDLGDLDRDEVLSFFAERIAEVKGLEAEALLAAFEEREKLGSTGIGGAIAIPHCRSPKLRQAIIAVGVAPTGVDFAALDGEPVRLFFAIVSAARDPRQNLRCLAAISSWAKHEGAVESLLANPSRQTILEALSDLPEV